MTRDQGVKFAVIVVRKSVIGNTLYADHPIRSFQHFFGGIPVVLMAQDHRGKPTYYGRRDIVRFLSVVPLNAIPWREYSVG
ncbi:MAG: hypothetical protein FJ135_01400 [Deltaproteobacteria bacterium]|nr:hypothetical protein [Deltaproteobacteria bacterium]